MFDIQAFTGAASGRRLFLPIGFCLFALVSSCTKQQPSSPMSPLANRGRAVYQTYCTACHNPDPKMPGSIGPDVYGSSRELIEARVLSLKYPPGYKPKRTTHAMTAFPQLKGDIDALYAYLNGK